MTIPTENHPGHALILIAELEPAAALDAWEAQLAADRDSGRKDGVLISGSGAFIGASAYLDHGYDRAMDILMLALASSVDGMWSENNGDERNQDYDELVQQTDESLAFMVGADLSHQVMMRFAEPLRERELRRRRWQAGED